MLAVLLILVTAGAFALPAAALVFRSRGPWALPARGMTLGLALVWTANTATVLWGAGWDSSAWFVAINLAFFGSASAALGSVFLVGVLVQQPVRGREMGLWLAGGLVFWLVGLYRALLAADGALGDAFGVATVFVALVAAFAGIRTLRHRNRLSSSVRRASLVFLVMTSLLLALGLWNDVSGLHWPLSPAFLVLGALAVYRAEFGRLPPGATERSGPDQWCRRRGISAREQEVLALVAAGVDRQAIADRLFISPVTVKNHLASLYRKTATSDLETLAGLARDAGLGGAAQPA